jgi:cell wall-associated NlpC family hydrolase
VAAATGVLAPSTATAAPPATPSTAAEATALVTKAARQLTELDAQVDEAELIIAQRQEAAAKAAQVAAEAKAAMAAYEPQLRAIAQTGFTGLTQSRVAAFLTSTSASDLVSRVSTLDMIAVHTNSIISAAAAAQQVALEAQADADRAAASAATGLAELEAQKAEVQKRIESYRASYAQLTAAEQEAVNTAVAGPALVAPSADSLPLAPSGAAAVAVRTALAQVGDPYSWGSSGPDSFDCSGLVGYAYAAAGVTPLPRTSRDLANVGRPVAAGEMQPGDLVWFFSPVSHIGIYVGNGMIVHARTEKRPVGVTTIASLGGPWGARRIAG